MKKPILCAATAGVIALVFLQAIGMGDARRNSRAVLMEGSCTGARLLSDEAHYCIPLRAMANDLGYIRIRSDAHWDLDAQKNVLGTVPCGSVPWGEGPLKDNDEPGGIGFAVVVRDSDGRVCRGYVSSSVVDVASWAER